MNVYKIIRSDIYSGIIKNKRFAVVPLLCFFECMYYDNFVRIISVGRTLGKPTAFDLFTLVFRGNDPISKLPKDNSIVELPYFWIAIFVFSVFIGFEYMRNDLTRFGTQILTRCQKRTTWWLSKCVWCALSSLWCYILILVTIVTYALLNDFALVFKNNYTLTNTLAQASATYEFTLCEGISTYNKMCLIIAPLTVIITLNMFQMMLSLFLKPIYSYLISVVIIIAGTFTDATVSFARSGMLLYNKDYFENGYSTKSGIIICLIITALSIILGGLYFKKSNILPEKE